MSRALGLALVVVGLGCLAVQAAGGWVWSFAWTLFIILPGLACLGALVLLGRGAAWLAVPGSVVTATGLLLLYQALTNLWQSWAYAWALVVPAALGLGLMLQGAYSGRPALRQAGRRLAALGLVIFLTGAVFFELVLNVSGLGGGAAGAVIGPALLIGAGAALLLRSRGDQAPGRPA